LGKRNGRATTPLPLLASASCPSTPASVAGTVMTKPNFGAGKASNELLRASGNASVLYTNSGGAREMRRAAERAAKKAARRAAKASAEA